jgi:membrane protein
MRTMHTGKPRIGTVSLWKIVRDALASWLKDGAPGMGAAISFYSLFAIAPILLMVIWVAGMFVGPEVVKAHVLGEMRDLLGETGSEAVAALLVSVGYATRGGYATAAGILTLVISASGMFAELQNALRRIWSSPPRGTRESLWQLLRTRVLSFGFLLGVGFLLLISLTAGAVLEAFGAWMGAFTVDWRWVVLGFNALLGFTLSTLLFAMLFKYVPPDQKIRWRDVWVGSIVTAALFLIGKLLIVTFLSRFAFRSAYGIAGSFLVLLLWVYYSTQIFLLGAEFTHKYALAHRPGGAADGSADAHAAPPPA